jgi:DNA-binding MarR family transcriptional regulator
MFSGDQKMKLVQIINEGMHVLQEIDDLSVGLNETIKAIAEEMNLKPSILKKAIKIAAKSQLGEVNKDHEDLNAVLETVGRTL